MIIRTFKCRVRPGKREAFEKFFNGKAVANVRAHKGLIAVINGAPLEPGDDAYIMTTIWRDMAALQGFIGPNWKQPFIDPDEADLITDVTMEHYDGSFTSFG